MDVHSEEWFTEHIFLIDQVPLKVTIMCVSTTVNLFISSKATEPKKSWMYLNEGFVRDEAWPNLDLINFSFQSRFRSWLR